MGSRVGARGGAPGAQLAVAGSQPRRAFLRREQLVTGDLPVPQSSRATAQGSDSPGCPPPRRRGGRQRWPGACLGSLQRRQVPARLSGMRCCSFLAPLLAKAIFPPAVTAPFPSLRCGEDAGAPVPARAGRGLLPAAGRAAAPAWRRRPRRPLPAPRRTPRRINSPVQLVWTQHYFSPPPRPQIFSSREGRNKTAASFAAGGGLGRGGGGHHLGALCSLARL